MFNPKRGAKRNGLVSVALDEGLSQLLSRAWVMWFEVESQWLRPHYSTTTIWCTIKTFSCQQFKWERERYTLPINLNEWSSNIVVSIWREIFDLILIRLWIEISPFSSNKNVFGKKVGVKNVQALSASNASSQGTSF